MLFGYGLILSGMYDPAKVQSFLNLSAHWDPSLGLVMVGAIGVARLGFAWAKHHPVSLLGLPIELPEAHPIDRHLVLGSLLFGIGWGLAGFCPAPGLLSLGTLYFPGWVFCTAMLVGMKLKTERATKK
jgi:uncharacterized membrane protein YedE/YeeE